MRFSFTGHCHACGQDATFASPKAWFRPNLKCNHCGSIPRERAFAWCLDTFAPNWRNLHLHECSPANRSISARMRREGRHYIGSQYFADAKPGSMRDGYRVENLEALTFADESLDLHCHLDVLEHVNRPGLCFREMERTLRKGGMMIFTTPVYEGKVETQRRARYTDTGVEHLFEPEYHGNPIDPQGSLVTFHYGSDLADKILGWAPKCSVNVITLNDPYLGVLGKFREVFVVTKRA